MLNLCASTVQLKITYSRHKDLNVKGNNERSFDYTQASTAQPGSAHPSYGAANRGNPAPIASYNGPNADLLAGGGGAPLGPHEMPPTGPTSACSITRSFCTPLARSLAWKLSSAWETCQAAVAKHRAEDGVR